MKVIFSFLQTLGPLERVANPVQIKPLPCVPNSLGGGPQPITESELTTLFPFIQLDNRDRVVEDLDL